jgi:ribose-phosphate pyrophosphokinase
VILKSIFNLQEEPLKLKIFAGMAGKPLAEEICRLMDKPLGKARVDRFSDGEVRVQLKEDVRGFDVFIVNPICPPAENFFDMVFLTDACVGSSAQRITIVPTYLGYNRQDRKDRPRVPISGPRVISMLAQSGCHRALCFDVHSEPTLSIFREHRVVYDHLYGSIVARDYLQNLVTDSWVIATTDAGGTARANFYNEQVLQRSSETVTFMKSRDLTTGEVDPKKIKISGEVSNRDVLFIDDLIDTAGTLCKAAQAAELAGAKRIAAFATHGLFSGNAIEKLDNSPIEEVIVTDSLPIEQEKLASANRVKITILPTAHMFATAIRKIYDNESLSSMMV